MNWIQRYKLRNYVRNSVWLLSVFGMVAGLVSVNCLHWVEVRAGWQSGFDPDAARALFGTLAGAMFTFIVFLSSILLLVLQIAGAQLTPRIIGVVFRDRVTRSALNPVCLHVHLYAGRPLANPHDGANAHGVCIRLFVPDQPRRFPVSH